MMLSPSELKGLADWLARELGADAVEISRCDRLVGGAVQENLALDVAVEGGHRNGRHALVLRTDAPSGVAESRSREQEFKLLQLVHRHGVLAPEPWALEPLGVLLDKPFFVMTRLPGEARGYRLVRDPAVNERGDLLVASVARELAKLHAIGGGEAAALGFLAVPAGPLLSLRIGELRAAFDALDEPQPVFEWGLRWLERHGRGGTSPALVHADLRTGNFLVQDGALVGILDWEFARLSDPLEDLGWMLARCWRFGATSRHAGGLGSREAFLAGYATASGAPVDPIAVQHWELFATLRWGLIALQQAQRHYSTREQSLELGLTLHVVPVLERDTLAYVEAIEAGRTI